MDTKCVKIKMDSALDREAITLALVRQGLTVWQEERETHYPKKDIYICFSGNFEIV